MSGQAWLTLVVVAGTVVLLVRDSVQPAVAVLGADVVLLVTGVIDTGAAFSGFSTAVLGPVAVLAAVWIATMVLTELITSNAAAVLLFPVAMATASQLQLNPRAFAVAVTIAASTSFITPIGYQTNTMVYGMGSYRFGDFVRLGLPVTLVSLAAIVIFVPLFWPL